MPARFPHFTAGLPGLKGWKDASRRWERDGLVERLWARDPSVWAPASRTADRWLGWLDLPRTMVCGLEEITRFAAEVVEEGTEDVVLMGMGGSSLAPEMFSAVFGSAPGHPRLTVLDSTHPEAVASLAARLDPARTLFLVSSKSGTTVETRSFHRYFWDRCGGEGARFAAITDRGGPLDALAREKGFRAVFNPPPDVGGRFSALSAFGLVPAALIGADLAGLLARAGEMAELGRLPPEENPAVGLGLALAASAGAGADKLTLRTGGDMAAFPAWMEQLVAESLGKDGGGIVPVAGEPPMPSDCYGEDRFFLTWEMAGRPPVGEPPGEGARIELEDRLDLGGEIFRAELAVAAAGEALGVDPFDQPDVEEAKRLASAAMARPGEVERADLVDARSQGAGGSIRRLVDSLGPGRYLGIQAYLPPGPRVEEIVAGIRRRVTEMSGAASTFGYGPRFLHSTGQVHKGGPPGGVFLQVVDDPGLEVEAPGAGFGFSRLIAAQAEGDYFALRGAGRTVLRLGLGSDRLEGLSAIAECLA